MPLRLSLRGALLFGIALNLCLIVVRASLYRPLWAMPGAFRFVVEPIIGLAGCGLFVMVATAGRQGERLDGLRLATAWGMAGGALLVVHMALENFGRHLGENTTITL